MSGKVIVLGAKGRFGRAALTAFSNAGWQVASFARSAPDATLDHIAYIRGDAMDAEALSAAAMGYDVIVNALNPPYEKWAQLLPDLTRNVITAAKRSGATVMIPGNVYNYGEGMPALLSEDTPHAPTTDLGRMRVVLEEAYAEAADHGVRTIVLRGGDFIERGHTDNWFDDQITPKIGKGRITYPGPMDRIHAWAYLPDMARAMAELADKRGEFAMFESFEFPGFAMTGQEMADALSEIAGRKLAVGSIPWGIMRLLQYVIPGLKGVIEMSYLWKVPHELDGRKLHAALPSFRATPIEVALFDAVADRLQGKPAPTTQLAT